MRSSTLAGKSISIGGINSTQLSSQCTSSLSTCTNTHPGNTTRMNLTFCNMTSESCGAVNQLHDLTLRCHFTRTVKDCLDDDGFVSYIQLTYCHLQSPSISTVILLFVLLFLFFAIGTNADDFLCPLLIAIAKSLNISDNIAGVTFLAFGNGAPDIFSSIVGISDDDPNLVIGQLYGAGIFVTTVVVGSILVQNKFQIMHRPLLRDITFYLVTTGLVWATFITGQISLANSLAFIGIYLVYVIVVIVSGILYKRQSETLQMAPQFKKQTMPRDKLNRQTKYRISGEEELESPKTKASISSYFKKTKSDNYEGVVLRRIKYRQYCPDPLHQRRFTLYNIHEHTAESASNNTAEQPTIDTLSHKTIMDDPNNNQVEYQIEPPIQSKTIATYDRRHTISDTSFSPRTVLSMHKQASLEESGKKYKFSVRKLVKNIGDMFSGVFRSTKVGPCSGGQVEKGEESKGEQEENQRNTCVLEWVIELTRIDAGIFVQSSPLGKIVTIIKAPIYVIYSLTIPVVDNELPMNGWNKPLNVAHLVISPQVCLLITQISFSVHFIATWQLHLIVLAVSFILLVMVSLTSQKDKPPPYHIAFAYFGFVVSISWIYTIATEVVNILDAIRVIFNLSKFMIGLTVLAWGNSIGDFISNLAMAKNGFPRMAISACFGGPVLNMLLGIGIPYTVLLARQNGAPIKLVYSNMISVLYGTITLSLLTTAITLLVVTKFRSARMHGFTLYAIYLLFILTAILTEMRWIL